MRTVVFRIDASTKIGAGHAMRCISIAQALANRDTRCVFAVSDNESDAFLSSLELETVCLYGKWNDLDWLAAEKLGELCLRLGAFAVVVDTYAATDQFFSVLNHILAPQCRIAFIDDMYSYEHGIAAMPIIRPVDIVVNYDYYASMDIYMEAYARTNTRLLVGPHYAPMRASFRQKADQKQSINEFVSDIVVSTGSTNPNSLLERLSQACILATDSNVRIHVIVGPDASFVDSASQYVIHKDVKDIAEVFFGCDIAVSTAGTTLYELSALGIPTLAVGMIDNQHLTVNGFVAKGYGLGCMASDETSSICNKIAALYHDQGLRKAFSQFNQEAIDACGADRVADALIA